MALRYRTGRVKPKLASEVIQDAGEFEPESLYLKTSSLHCERVNNSTFKITDGELINVPASRGQWAGYRTTKALVWVVKLGPDLWIARRGREICNPTSFNEAKSQALAMARGAAGDYFVADPIKELNELQARLLKADEDNASD